jgi:hypothetical protein
MKKNRKAHHRRTPSRRLQPTVIGVLLAFSLTASTVGNSQEKAAQPPTAETKPPAAQATKTAVATRPGTVTGTLKLDGEAIALRYVHAQRREARPSDAEQFQLKDGQKFEGGVIDLIVGNQPLTKKTMAKIVENKYRGSNTIRGVWQIFEPSGKYPSVHNFLLQSGTVPVEGPGRAFETWSKGDARIERGRFSGKLQFKLEEITTTKIYSFSFDAPLKIAPFEVKTPKTAVSAEQLLEDFQKIMPGEWTIERWWADSGHSYAGTLSVDEKLDEEEFRSTLHIGVSKDMPVEEFTITRQGTKIHFQGSVPPGTGTKWHADTLDFDLRGDLLVGSGKDDAGSVESSVVLRKVP